jgi:uncharacterized protein YigE (DUF2233 family)
VALRRPSIPSLILLAVLAVGAVLATQGARGLQWRFLEPGLDFATLRGEPYCRRGSAAIAVLRVHPRRFRLQVRHYSTESERRPLDVLEWRRRSDAIAVVNAGQYYPDFSYMGLLVSDGKVVSPKRHPRYQAAFVAEPARGQGAARVLDLAADPLDLDEKAWGEVAQSFMLFDRKGELRVRRTDRVANRTILGEDSNGRLLLIVTEGGYRLWELAQMLQRGPLDLTHAMSMDGGAESKLCVRAGEFTYASFGPWDGAGDSRPAGADVPLPSVITVSRR